MIKKSLLILWLCLLLSGVLTLFWYNDWVYQLPTPIPENYKSIPIGQVISLNEYCETDAAKPIFMHFFNPDCPCSRFNMKHFQSLVRQYGQQVNFVVVVMSKRPFTARAIQDKFDVNIPVLFDTTLASLCGVYSTPQAVLLNTEQQLYYRGNYNINRYCTDEKTSYAKIALNGMLRKDSGVLFDPVSLKPYGCSLPYCKN